MKKTAANRATRTASDCSHNNMDNVYHHRGEEAEGDAELVFAEEEDVARDFFA